MDEVTMRKAQQIAAEHPNSVLITTDENGQPVDRVMWTAKLGEDMTVYYATGLNSAKVKRIGTNPRVLVMWIGTANYVSLAGRAEVITDRAVLDDLWCDSFSPYFPGGRTDPNYAVIKITPEGLVCEENCDAPIDIIDLYWDS
jgi:general stress protein 26